MMSGSFTVWLLNIVALIQERKVFVTYLSNFSYDENIFFICLLGIFPQFRWFNIILEVSIVSTNCCFRCFHKLFLYTYVLYINRDKIKFWWLSILRNGVVSNFLFRTMHCGLNCHENILRVLLNFLEILIKNNIRKRKDLEMSKLIEWFLLCE